MAEGNSEGAMDTGSSSGEEDDPTDDPTLAILELDALEEPMREAIRNGIKIGLAIAEKNFEQYVERKTKAVAQKLSTLESRLGKVEETRQKQQGELGGLKTKVEKTETFRISEN
jgi:hypothetical protein